jgi:hypothetical protein
MPKPMMVVLTAALACSIFGGQKAMSMDLNQFQWKNRLLFIFAPEKGDAFFQSLQSEISTQPDEISERDLVVFSIFETGPSYQDNSQIDTRTAAAIRTNFAVLPGKFTCILVGKDGGIKLRQDSQVKLDQVFNLIDTMPMRREEMRQKSQSDESNTTN